jgi:SAM-dependent methyltransferase
MNLHESTTEQQIDDATVRNYFNGAGGGTASAISMMAHEHNLPASAARYRLRKEILTIGDWLDSVCDSGKIFDVGCGAGAWAEIFAKRYKAVIGVEQSPMMVKDARERVAGLSNVEIYEGDGRKDLPDEVFDMIFMGGLCMYMNDSDVVALLNSLKNRLTEGGSIILRESTVRHGVSWAKGDYQAVYRSVSLYRQLFKDVGSLSVEVRRNYGYTSMVTAEELVDLRRKWLPFLPKESTMFGTLTWWALRGTTPLSLWALPRVLSRLNISWPRLQNHFFRLRFMD